MTNKFDLSKFDKVLSDVVEIQNQGNFIPDCTTKEGYEASKRFVLDVTTPARKALEEAHKVTKKPFWDACKFLDSKKKELMPVLEQIEAPHKEAYKAVDEEKKRIKAEKEAAVQLGFDEINALVFDSVNASSEKINALIDECSNFDVDPDVYGKRTDELITLQADTMAQLTSALTRQIQFEDMENKRVEMERREREIAEKEAEQKRKEEAEQQRIREEQIAKDARAQAEKDAIAAQERAKEEVKCTYEAAISLCTDIYNKLEPYGYYPALTGGLLYKQGNRKDIDIVIYRNRQKIANFETVELEPLLSEIGLVIKASYGFVTKAEWSGLTVDIFNPETDTEAFNKWY